MSYRGVTLRRITIITFVVMLAWPAEVLANEASLLQVLTMRENPSIGEDAVVVLITGPIAPPAIEEFDRLLPELTKYRRVILDLDSSGGTLGYAEHFVLKLRQLRDEVAFSTLVRDGAQCLSACVLLFMQGEKRVAGGSSAWLFHGVRRAYANLPVFGDTERFVNLLSEDGMSADFAAMLLDRITWPGELWLSGYQLFEVYKAGVITDLLDPWHAALPEWRQLAPR